MITSTANAEQSAFWNEDGGREWVALQDRLDAQLAPMGEAALEAAAAVPGERALDVGCGCGATTLALAAAVGPSGSVRGVDISEPMAVLARQRATAAGFANVTVEVADAQTAQLPSAAHDLAFSRFGVMFFSDPGAAFANIRSAIAAGGRLAFVCWQKPADNAWSALPGRALMSVLPPQPAPDPLAPGPFAFADPDRVRSILLSAGWSAVEVHPFVRTMLLGGTTDFDETVELSLRIGPAARLLAGVDEDTRRRARAAIEDALRPHHTAEGINLDGACWVVTATNPA